MKPCYVYILTNWRHSVLYTGVTRDLKRRVFEHKQKLVPGFTARYGADRLVYYEYLDGPLQAISREKQIKGGSRRKKLLLIDDMNPKWEDLYEKL